MRAGKVYLIYPHGGVSNHTRTLYHAEAAVMCAQCANMILGGSYFTLTNARSPLCQVCQPWIEPWATSYLDDPDWVRKRGPRD